MINKTSFFFFVCFLWLFWLSLFLLIIFIIFIILIILFTHSKKQSAYEPNISIIPNPYTISTPVAVAVAESEVAKDTGDNRDDALLHVAVGTGNGGISDGLLVVNKHDNDNDEREKIKWTNQQISIITITVFSMMMWFKW